MARKSRAEIQKAYRERKKAAEGSRFLAKEVRRVQKYYRSTVSLSSPELEKRREEIRKSVAKHRKTRQESINDEPTTSSGRLPVRLDFNREKKTKPALKLAGKKISSLEKRVSELTKINNRVRKRNERLVAGASAKSKAKGAGTDVTPRSRTNKQLKEAGLNPKQVHCSLRKRLLFSNVLVDEIRESTRLNKSTSGKRIIRNIISGRIVKNYRLVKAINEATKLARNSLLSAKSKSCAVSKQTRLLAIYQAKKEQVKLFLEQDDNSRMIPGKNDAKKSEGVKVQKRILNDYLYNLHAKFQAEHPIEKMSRATFCRFRPSHIVLAAFTSRKTCLCQWHQNLALVLRAVKGKGATNTVNPDKFIAEHNDQKVKELLDDLEGTSIEYEQWKRVQDEDGKKRMKIVKIDATKVELVAAAGKAVNEFRQHASRVSEQYGQLKKLKENLPAGEAIAQMDFAENYLCQSCDEVQSAYWNSTMVSLHPVVTYFKDGDDNLQHKSFVYTSDELSHNATSVFLIRKKFVPELKCLVPVLSRIHYWTDSPTS